MTKAELLADMAQLGACDDAIKFVSKHPSDDAKEIGLSCPDVEWLIWYLGRKDPVGIAAFARCCAVRSGSPSAATDAASAERAAAYARAAATCAATAARYAERAEQLKDLHAMWSAL